LVQAVIAGIFQKVTYALQYASEELRGDREVVLAAVKQDGDALQYASQKLRREKKQRPDLFW
jgi:hypothetical protein